MTTIQHSLQEPQVSRGLAIPYDDERHHVVCRFFSYEARLLNNNDLRAWLALLDKGIRYLIPVRTNRLPADGAGFASSVHVDDDYEAILGKIRRTDETSSAWAEQPHSRMRRLITNTEVFPTDNSTIVDAISSVAVQRNRGNSNNIDHISGERHDRVKIDSDGHATLLARTMYLDHALLGTPNLAFFF